MYYASITNELKSLGSEKWLIHYKAREKISAGMDIIELTIGEPDVPIETDLIEECSKALLSGRTKYSSGRGEPNLLARIEERYNKISNSKITSENILCFPGTQTALYTTIRALAEKGDQVVVGDPMYATYEGLIRASGAEMVPVPLHSEKNFIMQLHLFRHF